MSGQQLQKLEPKCVSSCIYMELARSSNLWGSPVPDLVERQGTDSPCSVSTRAGTTDIDPGAGSLNLFDSCS
jgi:hypothetical protein